MAIQCEGTDDFNDASCAEYFTQPRIPEGTVHLIIGESLVRVLAKIQAHWQVGILSFSGAAILQMLASLEMLEMKKKHTVTLMMVINDVSRGESRKMVRLPEKVSLILEELRICLDPTVLTIFMVPYKMMQDQNALNMNERVCHIIDIIREEQKKSILPLSLLDVAWMMEISLPDNSSSDGIHFDKPKGTEWLNGFFQKHVNSRESDLLEAGQFTSGPPPRPSFFSISQVGDQEGEEIDSRSSSVSSRSGQPSCTTLGNDVTESSTRQSSVVSSVVIVEKDKSVRTSAGRPMRSMESQVPGAGERAGSGGRS